MSARDAIPELETAETKLTFADALARLTATAEAGWGRTSNLELQAKAAGVLCSYFKESSRYRAAVLALRAARSSDMTSRAKEHRASAKACASYQAARDLVVTFDVDESYLRAAAKRQAVHVKGVDGLVASGNVLDTHAATLERARTKVLAAHGISKLA